MRRLSPAIVCAGKTVPSVLPLPSPSELFSSLYCSTSAAAAAAIADVTETPLETNNSSHLISCLSDILSRRNWFESGTLRSLAPSVTPAVVAELLRGRFIDAESAFAFFNWIGKRPGFNHTVDFYASLVYSLLRSKSCFNIEKVVIFMLKSCGSAEEVCSALETFKAVRREGGGVGFNPSIRCYNTLLLSLSSKEKNLAEAYQLLGGQIGL
ncbi:hypothetical protein ZIOFF_074753 [Zingiber officinale]|uniref:Pentatricopeptide repeat-containing protein n=1 Tax=Zingiber officinale TaxID=94328 RepID=A0A8J5E916_ZINOF|nr:hypothetical protein ZIOFF_074753 [Zingiber officinale]